MAGLATISPPTLGFGRIIVSVPKLPLFTFELPLGMEVGLTGLQNMVGGNIEFIVDPMTTDDYTVFGYEEARIFNKPLNVTMTQWLQPIYGYDMMGTFVILGADEGRSIPLTHDQVLELSHLLPKIELTDFSASAWPLIAALQHTA